MDRNRNDNKKKKKKKLHTCEKSEIKDGDNNKTGPVSTASRLQ